MLILNNGVPKSGSTWVQQIVSEMVDPELPAKKWLNDWINPSIPADKLSEYVSSEEWNKSSLYVLIKLHVYWQTGMEYLLRDGIKIIVSFRNIPDSVLSRYHHQVHYNKPEPERMRDWLETEGVKYARRMIQHRNSWSNTPGVLFLRYESLLSDTEQNISKIAKFLEVDCSDPLRKEIARRTSVDPKKYEQPQNDQHIRTAGRSRARIELPKDIYEALVRMEQQEALSLDYATGAFHKFDETQ